MLYSFCTISKIVKITLETMENLGFTFEVNGKQVFSNIEVHIFFFFFLQSMLTSWVDTLLTTNQFAIY